MVNFKKIAESGSTVNISLSDQILQGVQDRISTGGFVSLIVKVAIILIAPTGLYLYEKNNKNKLEIEKMAIQQKLNGAKETLKKEKSHHARYDGRSIQHGEFEKKMGIMKTLADRRLVVIRVLDNIQSSALGLQQEGGKNFIFFNNISINGEKINIDGSASDEEVINQFVQLLQENPSYKTIRWEDVKSDKQSKIKRFRVTGEVLIES